jgi:hypothetical protein
VNIEQVEAGRPAAARRRGGGHGRGANTIRITSSGIRSMSLFLSDEIVDLNRDVKLIINATPVREVKIHSPRAAEGLAVVRLPAKFDAQRTDNVFDLMPEFWPRRRMYYGWTFPLAFIRRSRVHGPRRERRRREARRRGPARADDPGGPGRRLRAEKNARRYFRSRGERGHRRPEEGARPLPQGRRRGRVHREGEGRDEGEGARGQGRHRTRRRVDPVNGPSVRQRRRGAGADGGRVRGHRGALVVEIAVVRAVAPWFGQGPYVWANAVGVTLLALALGAAVGGRWAARDPDGRALPWAAAAAALWLAGAASAVAPLAAWLVPVDVAADRPLPLSLWASLLATVVVLGPPVVVLGAVPPVLVARARGEAGRASGRLSAAGTIGALVGCAATGPWLVPAVGSRGALAVGGVLAAVVALLTARPVRSRGRAHADAVAHARCRAPVATLVLPSIAGLLVTVLEFTAFRALTPAVGGTNATFAASIAAVMAATALGAWGASAGADRRTSCGMRSSGASCCCPVRVFRDRWPGQSARSRGAPRLRRPCSPPRDRPGLSAPADPRRRHRGRAAGAVLAASTAASLVGCYLTPLVLLPELGVRVTCYAAAGLGLSAIWWFGWLREVRAPAEGELAAGAADDLPSEGPDPAADSPRTGPRMLVAGCALLATVAAVVTPRGPLRHDEGQVEELESAYQTVRSVETRETVPVTLPGRHPLFGGERDVRTRFLRFDEDATSYQSVALPDDAATLLTAGRYYDHLALGAWFDGMPWTRPDGPLRVLVVGYCGGTLHRTLLATAPAGRRVEVVGVELDPTVTALARRHFGPFPEGLELYEGRDAREVLDRLPIAAPFDLVLVDAYQRTQYVPFQLATVEFFRAVRRRLASHGAVAVNMNAPTACPARSRRRGASLAGLGGWAACGSCRTSSTTRRPSCGGHGRRAPRWRPTCPRRCSCRRSRSSGSSCAPRAPGSCSPTIARRSNSWPTRRCCR